MTFADGKILLDIDGGIALVTFNNPEKRNAMSLAMWDGLVAALDAVERDAAVRVLVLTGAGAKAFVSGADISQFDAARADAAAQRDYDRRTAAGRARLAAFPRPVIARIRGYCLGGGLALALQADLRIAAEESEFGIPAARLGVAYSAEMVRQLVSVVGPAHARMLLYTGSRIEAREAERIGLVNQVVADADLSDTVRDLARTIADNAPLSIAASKRTINEVLKDPADRDMDAVRRAGASCFDSADYKEGRSAFLEKRRAAFTGR